MAGAYESGLPFETDGRCRMTVTAGAGPFIAGWGMNAALDAALRNELGASAVPATAIFIAGLAFDSTGAIYTTVNSPASFTNISGKKVRQDGALFVEIGTSVATDAWLAGWAFRQATGAALISVI